MLADWLQKSLVTSNVFDKELYSIQSEMIVVNYFMIACDVMSCGHLISFACTVMLQSHVPLNWIDRALALQSYVLYVSAALVLWDSAPTIKFFRNCARGIS